MVRVLSLAAVLALVGSLGTPVVSAEGGRATPGEAAQALLIAWQAKDAAGFRAALLESERENAEQLFACLEIASFKVAGVEERGTQARVRYTWETVLSVETLAATLKEAARALAVREGKDAAAAEADVRALEETLLKDLPTVKARLERKEQVMFLRKTDRDGWLVAEPCADPKRGGR